MFIDTHAHLYGEEFSEDLDQVVRRAQDAGAVRILIPPTDAPSTAQALALCDRYPGVCFPMVGLHPEDVDAGFRDKLSQVEALLRHDIDSGDRKFIAIGEVGLDYYWDKTYREEQKEAFSTQIGWAAQYGLPLMIHARSANGDLLECLSPWCGKLTAGGVFHCFSGSVESARELLRLYPSFCVGIGGVLTFKKSKLPEVVREIPLDRIVLETDSPYMAPVPMRGKRNEPAFIPYIIEMLAQAKDVTPDEVGRVTTANAMRLFFPQTTASNNNDA